MKRNHLITSIMCVILTLSLSACNTTSNTTCSFNHTNGYITLTATEKTSFAETCNQMDNTTVVSEEDIRDLLTKAAFSDGEDIADLHQQLESYGIYYFSGAKEIDASSNSDVTINAPAIYFNANSRQWIVICSGYWHNEKWKSYSGNVGKSDSFGVSFDAEDETYSSCVVDTYAFITDEDFSEFVSTENRSDGDGAKGFTFTLQDYANDDFAGKIYVGYRWFGMCVYDANFSSYNCTATAFYEHTY